MEEAEREVREEREEQGEQAQAQEKQEEKRRGKEMRARALSLSLLLPSSSSSSTSSGRARGPLRSLRQLLINLLPPPTPPSPPPPPPGPLDQDFKLLLGLTVSFLSLVGNYDQAAKSGQDSHPAAIRKAVTSESTYGDIPEVGCLGLRSVCEPPDLVRPGRQPQQQGLSEARLGWP